MTSSDLDLRLQRFRSRRDEYPHALASALIEAGRSSDALEVIHLGLLDDESNLELLTLEGRAYYVQGDLQEAQRSLLRAAKVDPRHKEPYRWLAQVLIERGDAVRAVQVLERAIGLDPNDAALRQSYARAQRMAGGAAAARSSVRAPEGAPVSSARTPEGAPASSARTPEGALRQDRARPSASAPRSSPPPAASARELPLTREPARRESAPRPSERPTSTTPSTLGPAVKNPPANQNDKRSGIADLVARAGSLRSRSKPSQELLAEDLLREPTTDMGLSAKGRAPSTPTRPSLPLPFEEETDRDDESPTTAVEVPEEVRSWLRTGQPRANDWLSEANQRPRSERPSAREPEAQRPPVRGHEQVLASDDDDDDEASVPTSIVPAAQELELLRRREAAQAAQNPYDQDEGEPTLFEERRNLAEPGQAEPPEQVLQLLQTQGVFETSGNSKPAAQGWLGRTEIPFVGTPIRRALAVAWGVALVAAIGGYFGFQSWLGKRRAEAVLLVEKAHEQVLDGQHSSLLAAERTLAEARALDPKSSAVLSEQLFVEAARAFDEGSSELGALRSTLQRAEQSELSTPIVAVATALVQPVDNRKRDLDKLLSLADKSAPNDAEATYVVARIAQHAGQLEATKRLLKRAVATDPELAVAQVALGEQARADGELEHAQEAFEKALGLDKQQLRAELWLSVLGAKAEDAAALQSKLDALMPRVEQGSDADKLLAYSVRAFAAQAAGDTEKAKQALRVGSALRADDPELLAFFSEQALRAGEHTLAYRAARAASEAGGDAARFQPMIAAALMQQGDGDAALTALANVGEGHGALALARASAALLTDSRESLEAAKKELASYRATSAGKDDVEASALLIRVDLRLGANVESLFPAARALAQRAPGSLAPQLALAEAMLAAGQGTAALQALEPALKLAPGSADALYLLGRAQRLVGKPNEARASFERAVAVAPNHVEAQRALGRSLLDGGEFDAALSLFRALESAAGSSATLGVIEALIDKRSAAEASTRFDALSAVVKTTPVAQLLHARLDLLRGNPLDAIKTLEPLISEDAESRTAESLALYGDALYRADKVDSAAAAYDAALELDDSLPDALIGRAVAAVRSTKPDPALALLGRADAALAKRARPPRVRALWLSTMGRAELQKNQLVPALDHFARAVALPEVTSETFFWYGEALAKNKSDQAGAQYSRYLTLEPNGLYAARAKRGVSVP